MAEADVLSNILWLLNLFLILNCRVMATINYYNVLDMILLLLINDTFYTQHDITTN